MITKTKFLILIFIAVFLSTCSKSADKEKLLNVYKEILIARESNIDSIAANKAVQKVLRQNHLTEIQFRNEIFELAKSETNFLRVIDSLRSYVKFEQKRIMDSVKRTQKPIKHNE